MRNPWRQEPVRVPSPLPADVAISRLRAEVLDWMGFRRRAFAENLRLGTMLRPWRGPRLVVGRVAGDAVSLRAVQTSVGSAFPPHLRGRVVPAGDGCELVGTIDSRQALVAGVSVLVAAASLFVAGGALAAAAIFVLFGAVVLAFGERQLRRNEQWLRSWLDERLAAA